MIKQFVLIVVTCSFNFSNAQDITQNQVPSLIVNLFSAEFQKGTDIEWEMDGTLYTVDFETAWYLNHTVWYNEEGNIVKHMEDIQVSKLPKAVKQKIKSGFSSYIIDDIERITENEKIVYRFELNSMIHQDWDVVVDSKGKIVSKIVD
ncbi:PepSY-like domain-containing protein [Flagellimonas sp.]|uniref:PepSY-like domain-containing protein n=1 Tax=Flagellimonas sp. TaxID=2058762 RepID=UPI003BA9F57F